MHSGFPRNISLISREFRYDYDIMGKMAFIIAGVLIIAVVVVISPFLYLGLKSAHQQRALQNRSDYPQIAAACVTLARAITNDAAIIWPTNAVVPPHGALTFSAIHQRNIEPRYVGVSRRL